MVDAGSYERPSVVRPGLGYGCAGLMARIDRRQSVTLLEHAFDAGITHFDVARSYGYGEAESALGDFLRDKRDRVTVTTKLGIQPPRPSRGLAAAKGVVRRLGRAAAPLRRMAARRAQAMQTAGSFGVGEARASLETSLRELGTDYVDVLLLHECRPGDVGDELLEFLEDQVRAGTVRTYGMATDPESTRALATLHPPLARVLQVPDSLVSPAVEELAGVPRQLLVTHSAVAPALDEVERRTGADRAELGDLLLAAARLRNPDGVVLFSSRDPARIRRNAAADPAARRDEVDRLAALVSGETAPHPG